METVNPKCGNLRSEKQKVISKLKRNDEIDSAIYMSYFQEKGTKRTYSASRHMLQGWYLLNRFFIQWSTGPHTLFEAKENLRSGCQRQNCHIQSNAVLHIVLHISLRVFFKRVVSTLTKVLGLEFVLQWLA